MAGQWERRKALAISSFADDEMVSDPLVFLPLLAPLIFFGLLAWLAGMRDELIRVC